MKLKSKRYFLFLGHLANKQQLPPALAITERPNRQRTDRSHSSSSEPGFVHSEAASAA